MSSFSSDFQTLNAHQTLISFVFTLQIINELTKFMSKTTTRNEPCASHALMQPRMSETCLKNKRSGT